VNIDHFLLSEVLFNTAVEGVFALHDIDNTSDHEPVILQLSLQVKYVQYSERVYTPQIAWAKAKDVDRNKYRSCLSQLLCHICVPTDAIMCESVSCSDDSHSCAVNLYVEQLTQAVLLLLS